MMTGPLVRKGRSAYLRLVLIQCIPGLGRFSFRMRIARPVAYKIRGSGDFERVKDLQKIGQKQTTDEF